MSLQQAQTDAYRRSPYPTAIHPQTHPDRLAAIARLTGLDPPDIRTARVLEVGAGNGMNLLAMAAALPDAHFVGIDIEPEAIAEGRRWAAASALDNVDLRVLDLLDAADALDGGFDYIIAHGVFAWVPEAVADALMALIARRLSPRGIAFVSYNALPGCYLRMPMRDIMRRAADGIEEGTERLALGRAALARLVEPRATDGPAQTAFRYHAQVTIERTDNVLLHDEMGGCYRPRYLADVIAQARGLGLAFLGDSTIDHLADALLTGDADPAGDHQAQVEAHACDRDVLEVLFFRQTLLVRADAAPRRRVLDAAALDASYAATDAREVEPGVWERGSRHIQLADPGLKQAMTTIARVWPGRVRVGDLRLDNAHLKAVFGLFDAGMLTLHTIDAPFPVTASDRPVTSPLVRTMLSERMPWVASLDFRSVAIGAEAVPTLLALDGAPDAGRLAAAAADAGLTAPGAIEAGIAALAHQALFVR